MQEAKKKPEAPEFNTEAAQAEFWEYHSPFDNNLKLERAKTEAPKDRPITIRLDSQSKQKLEQLAAAYHMGPSTFARRIIDAAIRRLSQKPDKSLTAEKALELIAMLAPKDLEDKANILIEENPALVDAITEKPEVAEAFAKEFMAFILRVGSLLKSSGFKLESLAKQPAIEPPQTPIV